MTEPSETTGAREPSSVSDLCLLLRAHAEARWLCDEVEPVLRQIESDDAMSEAELEAARAYLEVLWIEACGRAAETEATLGTLAPAPGADSTENGTAGASANGASATSASGCDLTLQGRARRYHSAVRHMRDTAARRVSDLVRAPADAQVRQPFYDRRAGS